MTSLQSSIEAVQRVLAVLPIEFTMSDHYPADELMHVLTTMQVVEAERVADGIPLLNEDGSLLEIQFPEA